MHRQPEPAPVRSDSGIIPDSRPPTIALPLAVVLLVALSVRLYLAGVMPLIARDGATFIAYAQRLSVSPLDEIRRQKQHPLFPAAMAATHAAFDRVGVAAADPARRWVLAGQVVALTASLALVVAVYALTRAVFDRRTGLVAAGCAAMLPELARHGVDVLSDSPHLALYVAALAVGVRGWMRRCAWRSGLAGLLSGLAYLARPEGAEAALVLGTAIVLARSWPSRRRLAAATVCAIGFLLPATPYMLATGALVRKKPISQFVTALRHGSYEWRGASSGLEHGLSAVFTSQPAPRTSQLSSPCLRASVASSVRGAADYPLALGKVLENYVRSLRVMYVIPVLAWLALRRRCPPPSRAARLLVAAGVLHATVCTLMIPAFDYWGLFSLRHVLILAALTLPWTAAGIVQIVDTVRPRVGRRAAWIALGVVLVAPTLPWLLRAPNAEDAYLRDAGEWIRAHYPASPRILTDRWRVPLYADAVLCERLDGDRIIRWPGEADVPALLGWIADERPDLVVLDAARLERRNPAFFDELDRLAVSTGLLTLEHKSRAADDRRGKRALVYRVRK